MVACEDTRHTRGLLERYGVSAKLVSYHEHNERARAAELVERMRAARSSRWSATPACRWSPIPVSCWSRAASPRAWRSRCCPGPSSALTALVASALPTDVWRFAGFLPRKRGALETVFAAPETVVAFESPRRVGASLAVAGRTGPRAPCRGLPRADQAARGDRPRQRRRAGRRVRRPRRRAARSCSWSAARPSHGRRPRGGRGGPHARGGGRTCPAVAASVVAELTGAPANELYREVAT